MSDEDFNSPGKTKKKKISQKSEKSKNKVIVLDDNSEEEPQKKKPKITKASKEPKKVSKKDEPRKLHENSKAPVPSEENGNSNISTGSKAAQPPPSLVSFFKMFDAKAKPSEKAPFHSKSDDGRNLRNSGGDSPKKRKPGEASFDENLSKLLEMGFTIEVLLVYVILTPRNPSLHCRALRALTKLFPSF